MERKTYSKTGELLEYMILPYEARRYSFLVEMDVNPGASRDYVPDIAYENNSNCLSRLLSGLQSLLYRASTDTEDSPDARGNHP